MKIRCMYIFLQYLQIQKSFGSMYETWPYKASKIIFRAKFVLCRNKMMLHTDRRNFPAFPWLLRDSTSNRAGLAGVHAAFCRSVVGRAL